MGFIFYSFLYDELKKLVEEARHPGVALRTGLTEAARAVLAWV
jgi:hypothetical protein